MYLYELIYFSEKTDLFLENPQKNLDNIIKEAQSFNTENSITGMLFSSDQHFFQVLEGRRHTISQLFLKISQDKRNKNLVLVRTRPIAARRFANWSMSSLDVPMIEQSKFRKYAAHREFRPEEFTEETIDLFLITAFAELSAGNNGAPSA